MPTLYILNVTECNSNNNNEDDDCTTTTESSDKNKGNGKIKTTTETNSNNNEVTKSNDKKKGNDDEIKTSTKSSGNGGNNNNKDTTDPPIPEGKTLIVDPDRAVAKNMCLSEEKASGVVDSYLDTPRDGIFTFYGVGGEGACGIDTASASIVCSFYENKLFFKIYLQKF